MSEEHRPFDQRVSLPTESVRVTVVSDTRPTCDGTTTCTRRPEFIVSYTQNLTGMPGMGRARHRYACWRHLHSEVTKATDLAVGPVAVSRYSGV